MQPDKPWHWVPSIYFSQALPYAMVITISAIFYKNLALSNSWIAFMTSWFFLPWLLKPLWSTWLQNIRSPARGLIICQLVIAIAFALLAVLLHYHIALTIDLSLVCFIAIAFVSATFDMLSDGLYIDILSSKNQQKFVGVRTFFYQLARVACIGGLVMLVGHWADGKQYRLAWQMGFLLVAALHIILALWHVWKLPSTIRPLKPHTKHLKMIIHFFKQPGIISAICFLLLYNFGEAQMQRVVPLFLMSSKTSDGLGLGNDAVGLVFGLYGTVALSIGALASGWLIIRMGLRSCLWWMTILMVFSNIGYILLAYSSTHNIYLVATAVIIAQACFGLANSGYMCALLKSANQSNHALTWYAVASSLMALGMMLPGMLSGILLAHLNFLSTFIVILAISLLSFLVTACLKQNWYGR